MIKLICVFSAMLFAVSTVFGAISFTRQPSIKKEGSNWKIEFALSDTTDVEVTIVSRADSSIIRHLAAGRLGANSPEPLIQNALSQTIVWDGTDDLGKATAVSDANITVRVRAGMGVALKGFAGGNPYAFKGAGLGIFCFNGLTVSPDGLLYVFGSSGTLAEMTLRQYDAGGTYLKTVFPYPAGMAASDVANFGINLAANGSYSPKAVRTSGPILSALPAASTGSILLAADVSGNIYMGKLSQFVMKSTGASLSLPFNLIRSPAYLDDQYHGAGPFYLISSQDTSSMLLSGYYQGTMSSGHLVSATDTGFWQDGAVYKINKKTGVATRFISLDSVPTDLTKRGVNIGSSRYFSATHGVAEDKDGNVYVCDRHHRQIGVYDKNGAFLSAIKVDYPENVAVNQVTGEIFVVTRYESSTWHVGELNLNKYASFASGGARISTLRLTTATGDYTKDRPFMGLGLSNGKAVVWVGYITFGVRGYRDDGTSMTLIKDFYAENAGVNTGFDRITIDRKTETAYVGDSWNRICKISDWNNPVLVPCSTSAKKQLYAANLTISPDRKLYVREDRVVSMGGGWSGPVARYSLDYYHQPLPYANTGSHEILPVTERYGQGYPGRDIAVSSKGKIGFITERTFGEFVVGTCDDTGSVFEANARFLMPQKFDTAIYPVTGTYSTCGGIRFDMKGNLYVGSNLRQADHVKPSGFSSDPGYDEAVGSVIKFTAGSRGSISGSTPGSRNAQGASKIYSAGFAPFSGVPGHTCICRNPHFDVDPFGRLFIPNAITNKVAVLDNNGNSLVEFGEYGNADSKGAGSLVPGPVIPLGWPVGAASSDNYIYVTDMINSRLVRVQMTFELDNMPGFNTSEEISKADKLQTLMVSAMPNPFNGVTVLKVNVPKGRNVKLTIHDIRGQLIRDLSESIKGSNGTAYWNGLDQMNRPAAAGFYVAKLTDGVKVSQIRLLLSK